MYLPYKYHMPSLRRGLSGTTCVNRRIFHEHVNYQYLVMAFHESSWREIKRIDSFYFSSNRIVWKKFLQKFWVVH